MASTNQNQANNGSNVTGTISQFAKTAFTSENIEAA
eukprot:CAMPEP_0116109520 /NCGR_PEP_ID=MMETSP0327-20121206/17374_1 /TAXON_ID=44447 /ORGANISM="Pseudo-nitzschia delicatissima, Strain B596" /LENGTH=35 /DNA_ID= /DNA_START= /DNA_END= /DNA_ORIENTATION=